MCLITCKGAIEDLGKLFPRKSISIAKGDLRDWIQEDIGAYYQYCLKRDVIPELDLEKDALALEGHQDRVRSPTRDFWQSLSNDDV